MPLMTEVPTDVPTVVLTYVPTVVPTDVQTNRHETSTNISVENKEFWVFDRPMTSE